MDLLYAKCPKEDLSVVKTRARLQYVRKTTMKKILKPLIYVAPISDQTVWKKISGERERASKTRLLVEVPLL